MFRLLVVDDEPQMLTAYRASLPSAASWNGLSTSELDSIGSRLFGEEAEDTADEMQFDTTYCSQGEDAVARVEASIAEGEPYSVVFLDMRMPPGIDGKETARRIRQLDPRVEIVIVTGYSDHSPAQVAAVAGPIDKLFYLTKPFDRVEIRQLATSLSLRWRSEEDLRNARNLLAEKLNLLQSAYQELAASEASARHASLHDALTGLGNRYGFSQAVSRALAGGADPVLLFIDLDRFKKVNDTYGHIVGDELLKLVGSRMQPILPAEATLARLGGDEFGVLLTNCTEAAVKQASADLLEAIASPFSVEGRRVEVTASIGLARREPGEAVCEEELLRRADMALYVAKREGRNRCTWFQSSLDETAKLHRQIEDELRDAIANDEITLAYQPIVDPARNEAVGFEALARWTSPLLGSLSPALFVPIAEESGLILPMGNLVIRKALREAATWPLGYVSINLSPVQFQQEDLIGFILGECRAAGVDPARVQLEITETALFADAAQAQVTIEALRDAGFRIALDDFGTGYSSLVYLRDFPLDCIKIDRSFVSNMTADPQAEAIVRSVASLARALDMSVVAEGVESALQQLALHRAGCSLLQGFLIGKPTSDPQGWLRQWCRDNDAASPAASAAAGATT